MSDGLFDPVPHTRDPHRFDGLGHDARRTLRQAEMIEDRVHPATKLPLHPDSPPERDAAGVRCRDCRHLYVKRGYFDGSFNKCALLRQPDGLNPTFGPDMRGWWPACTSFEKSTR